MTYAVTATNDYLLNKWKDAYYGAQRCNLALNVMKEAADMDETTKANRTAELKFLRALFMFEGVKIFGPTGMPYIDETIAAEENDPKVHNGTDWSLDSEPLLASPPYTPPNTQLNILSYPVGRVKPA